MREQTELLYYVGDLPSCDAYSTLKFISISISIKHIRISVPKISRFLSTFIYLQSLTVSNFLSVRCYVNPQLLSHTRTAHEFMWVRFKYRNIEMFPYYWFYVDQYYKKAISTMWPLEFLATALVSLTSQSFSYVSQKTFHNNFHRLAGSSLVVVYKNTTNAGPMSITLRGAGRKFFPYNKILILLLRWNGLSLLFRCIHFDLSFYLIP